MNECVFCGNPLYECQAGSVHVLSMGGVIHGENSSEVIIIKDKWFCDSGCLGDKIAELQYHANEGSGRVFNQHP